MGDQPNFGVSGGPGGPPGLGGTAPDHPSALLGPPFHGNEGGLGHHMMPPGGPNGGPHPPSGPSPPMQSLPPLGGHLGAGIDGMMDLQQVGPIFSPNIPLYTARGHGTFSFRYGCFCIV